jgi:hypothetical protein
VELGSAFGVNVLLSAVVVDGSRATLSGVRLPPAVGSYVVKVHSPQGVAQGTLVVTDFPTSCKAKKASDASAPDGVYMLSTRDGSAQYETHCLMSTEGGGFTLALKVDGGNSASQFFFDSPQWLSDAPYQPAKTSPDDTFEAKLRSYTEVPVGDVLLKMRQGSGTARSLRLGVPTAVPHLKAAVTGSAKATQLGPAPWLALVPGSSLQPECLAEGFANHPGTSFSRARVRLGIVGNNEEDCVSPDSFVGVGAQVDMTGCTPAMPGPPGISAGFISGVGCGGSNVGPSYASVFALVYVREP